MDPWQEAVHQNQHTGNYTAYAPPQRGRVVLPGAQAVASV
jgi:hypothetical protein